jgi:hypothetical protein
MFAKANLIAKEFTRPFIISSKMYNGQCNSGIGTYVIINEDGWFVTAFHIIQQTMEYAKSINEFNDLLQKRKEVEADTTRNSSVKKGMLNKLIIPPNKVVSYSVWLGHDRLSLENIFILPEIDLAVGHIRNFEKNMVTTYPVFKDYKKSMDTGTSLCKLGFPFHSIIPTFDENNHSFRLPEGSLPMPLFPLEGIYTRTVEFVMDKIKIPLKYIETSSPGLRGQSGGPTFDTNGTIWAIQSQTKHYQLGFGDNTNGLSYKAAEHLQNQYLNVGLGIHSETIIEFCKLNNIAIHVSEY